MTKELEVTIVLEDEQLESLLEDNDIKSTKAKINKLKKLFEEVKDDYLEQLEEAFLEALQEIAQEEWGD